MIARVLLAGIFSVGSATLYTTQSATERTVRGDVLHIVKIAAGPAGTETKGTFALSEERSIFNRTRDTEVIVVFQWEGVPGAHRMGATWRSPDAATSSSSSFAYTAAGRRFGAVWRLPLTPTMMLGAWSIQATVDDQPGGQFMFEITDAAVAPGEPAKRPLSQAEVFERLSHITTVVHRYSPAGRELNAGAALAMSNGLFLTSLGVLDATDRLRLDSAGPDAGEPSAPAVLAWNRVEDWAVLRGRASDSAPAVVVADDVKVGDRCYTIKTGGNTGGRLLLEGQIAGQGPGGTWIASFSNGLATPGSPLVNEFGNAIGVIAGGNSDPPGVLRLGEPATAQAETSGSYVIPIKLVRGYEAASPASLSDLRARGELIPALTGEEHVASGGFAASVSKTGVIPSPVDSRDHFSIQERGFVLFVNWYPTQRLKGVATVKMYDARNKLVGQSKPVKRDLKKGEYTWMSWDLPMVPSPGAYRADVFLDDSPVWRAYVRITP